MGDIGKEITRREYEPLTEPAQVPEPDIVPEPEPAKVPA